MSQEKTRFLSYICPRCRQSVIVEDRKSVV